MVTVVALDQHLDRARLGIEQFADGVIVVQFVDHECDVFAQVYVNVIWTG